MSYETRACDFYFYLCFDKNAFLYSTCHFFGIFGLLSFCFLTLGLWDFGNFFDSLVLCGVAER